MTLGEAIDKYVASHTDRYGSIFVDKGDNNEIIIGSYTAGTIKYGPEVIVYDELLSAAVSNELTMSYIRSPGFYDLHYTIKKENEPMNNIDRHAMLCQDLHDTYKIKNRDYGDSFHKSYLDWGLQMACVRLGDKYNRLCSIVKNGEIKVKDESIRDTLMDLANYAIMTVMELDGEDEE